MRVYGSFSNCHWSKHQDFVKVAARSPKGNEAARRRQDHERGERGPRPLGVVPAGEDGAPVEVQHPRLGRGCSLSWMCAKLRRSAGGFDGVVKCQGVEEYRLLKTW